MNAIVKVVETATTIAATAAAAAAIVVVVMYVYVIDMNVPLFHHHLKTTLRLPCCVRACVQIELSICFVW